MSNQNNSSKGHHFGSDRWIALKVLQEFSEIVFLGVAMESLLCEEKVKSQQTTIMVLKCHNFGSNRWITLKVLQNFLEVVFLGVAI